MSTPHDFITQQGSIDYNKLTKLAYRLKPKGNSRKSIIERGGRKLDGIEQRQQELIERNIYSKGYAVLAILSFIAASGGAFYFIAPNSPAKWLAFVICEMILGFVEYICYKRSDEFWDKVLYLKRKFHSSAIEWFLFVIISLSSSCYGAYKVNYTVNKADPHYMAIRQKIDSKKEAIVSKKEEIKGYEDDPKNYVREHGVNKINWLLDNEVIQPLRKEIKILDQEVKALDDQLPIDTSTLSDDYANSLFWDSVLMAGIFLMLIMLMQYLRYRVSKIDYKVTVEAFPKKYIDYLVQNNGHLTDQEVSELLKETGVSTSPTPLGRINGKNKEKAFQ